MRLSIDHRTTYRFTAPQGRVVQLLRMTPRDTHDQTVADWHISVDRDAQLRQHRDGFGNLTTMLYAEGPLDRIEIAVTGEVVTSHCDGVLHGSFEPLPPELYLRATAATAPGEQIIAFAHEHGEKRETLSGLEALNRAVRERFGFDDGRPDPGLIAEQAFARSALPARDMAHIMIAAARVIGVPARYVTGYCDLRDGGRPTSHGWVEAWVERIGWVGFDPTLGLSPQDHHVRVAVALDASGSSPVAGSRLGEGRESLDVEVSVNAED